MNYVLFQGRPLCVNFSSHPGIFHIQHNICLNPNCTAHHVTLQFTEIDGQLTERKKGITFPLDLNLTTGQQENAQTLPPAIQAMVDEFVRELTPAMRKSISDDVSFEKTRHRAIQEYIIDSRILKSDSLIPFTDIVSGKKSVASGGTACRFKLQHNGIEYFIEDHYCPRPSCRCSNVHLLFMEGTAGADGALTALTHLFWLRVPFRGKMEIQCGTKDIAEKARDLSKQFFDCFPHVMDEFKKNYRIVKDIGTRSIAASGRAQPEMKVDLSERMPETTLSLSERTSAVTGSLPSRESPGETGRNEPCPCGSGKKYKRCCGQTPPA